MTKNGNSLIAHRNVIVYSEGGNAGFSKGSIYVSSPSLARKPS